MARSVVGAELARRAQAAGLFAQGQCVVADTLDALANQPPAACCFLDLVAAPNAARRALDVLEAARQPTRLVALASVEPRAPHRALERRVLALGGRVLRVGLLLGNGSPSLEPMMRRALLDGAAPPTLGDGSNALPVAHIGDVVSAALDTLLGRAEAGAEAVATAAVDPPPTQRELLAYLCELTGLDAPAPPASDADLLGDALPGELALRVDNQPRVPLRNPDWRLALRESVALAKHALAIAPPRLLVLGPPRSGRTTVAASLAQRTGCVRVTAPDALAWCLETASPLAAALRAALDEFAAARAKKRPPAAKKKPGAEECVERPHVPTQLMAQAVRARLEAQDARERGFVLDGFPGDAAELAAIDTPLDAAVELAVERAAAEARLTDALEGYSDRPGFERRWAAHAERVRDALAALAAKQVPLLRVDSAHTPPDHAARQLVALARQKPRGQQAERAAQAEKEPEKAPQELLEEQKRGERAADSVREDEREVLEARLKAKREEILSSGELQSLFQAARGEAGAVAM